MVHAYHHLNTNSQNATAAAVEDCVEDDFFRWRQFPTDIDSTFSRIPFEH
jgi:hypothetical protein